MRFDTGLTGEGVWPLGRRPMNRRIFGVGALASASTLLSWSSAEAEGLDWPAKPVRIIEYFPAGVARDNRTRVIAEKLSALLGQQVFVDNRPGASGRIGLTLAAKAAPDGYTFAMIGPGDVISRSLFQLPYDIERDFDPVSMIESLPVVAISSASLPFATLSEVIAHAKAHPGDLTYASTGVGSFHHLNGLLFSNVTGASLRHVPYAQGSPVTDLIGGHVDLMFDALPPWLENVKAGNLRALAVTGDSRAKVLPNVPTFSESDVPAYDPSAFYGLIAPKGTPQTVIAKMQTSLVALVNEPALNRQWSAEGGLPVASGPSDFAARIRSESVRWAEVIRSNDIKI